MKKALLVPFALVVGAALTTPALAAQKPMVARGTIVSVDQQANAIVVKEKKGDVTFDLAKDAKIVSGKTAIAESQLKPGEHVRVSYTQVGQQRTAEKVTVWTGQKAMKKGAAKW